MQKLAIESLSSFSVSTITNVLTKVEMFFIIGLIILVCISAILFYKLMSSFAKRRNQVRENFINSTVSTIFLHLVVDCLLHKSFSFLEPYLSYCTKHSALTESLFSQSYPNHYGLLWRIINTIPKTYCCIAALLSIFVIFNLLNRKNKLIFFAILSISVSILLRFLFLFDIVASFDIFRYFFYQVLLDVISIVLLFTDWSLRRQDLPTISN